LLVVYREVRPNCFVEVRILLLQLLFKVHSRRLASYWLGLLLLQLLF